MKTQGKMNDHEESMQAQGKDERPREKWKHKKKMYNHEKAIKTQEKDEKLWKNNANTRKEFYDHEKAMKTHAKTCTAMKKQ